MIVSLTESPHLVTPSRIPHHTRFHNSLHRRHHRYLLQLQPLLPLVGSTVFLSLATQMICQMVCLRYLGHLWLVGGRRSLDSLGS